MKILEFENIGRVHSNNSEGYAYQEIKEGKDEAPKTLVVIWKDGNKNNLLKKGAAEIYVKVKDNTSQAYTLPGQYRTLRGALRKGRRLLGLFHSTELTQLILGRGKT